MVVGYHPSTLMDNCKYYFWRHVYSEIPLLYYGYERFDMIKNYKEHFKQMDRVIRSGEIDYLIFNERLLRCTGFKNFNINIPKIMIINDAHFFLDNVKRNISCPQKHTNEFIKKNNIKLILSRTNLMIYKLKKFFGMENIEWFPKCVDTKVFKDYGEEYKYDVISTGHGFYSNIKQYPFRSFICEMMSPKINYHVFASGEHKREEYARDLSKAKILVFGNGLHNIPVQKIYEGMASNCLVMHNGTHDDQVNHFDEQKNYVCVNRISLNDLIKFFLENEKERMRFIKNANETIKKYHTVEIRTKQLIKHLEEI
jgi:glycosyltransferase involved in cell wall biosynthesis